MGYLESIQSDQVCVAFGWPQTADNGFSLLFVVPLWTDSHPEAGGPLEIDYLSGFVFTFKLFEKLLGFSFVLEGSNLDAPATAGIDGMRGLIDVDSNRGKSCAVNAGCFCGSHGEI